MELPKLEDDNIEKDENLAIIQWMEFIGAKSKGMMEMVAKKNKDIKKAYDYLSVISKDERSRIAYEAREAEIHDQMTRIKTAEEKGRKEGRLEGEREQSIIIAKNLLGMGMDILTVVKVTGLDEEEIQKVKNNMH